MGSGTYYAVGFGCAKVPNLNDDHPLFEIFDQYGIQTSYEGATNYAVVPLLSTLIRGFHRDHGIPDGVMPVEDLSVAIRMKIGEQAIARATETWRIVRDSAAALAVPVNLPDGALLWLCDHD